MKVLCIVLAFAAMAAAHYPGFPFVHMNEGKYGAQFPYGNYRTAYQAAPQVHGNGYGYGFNNEFNYRGFGAYPVHVGNGNFVYLGKFNGNCAQSYNYGFYFAGDPNSFVVCDNGRAHTFACPKGTKNRDAAYFEVNRAYGMHELCGVNTNN